MTSYTFAPLRMKNNGERFLPSSNQGNFYAIGLNYKKADAEIRGHFSISETAQQDILAHAKRNGITSLSVISTCNRTELYGIAQHPFQLIKLPKHFQTKTTHHKQQQHLIISI